ncbi:zinc ribbon domain-containing protein [Desmospora profundinema]|uniref:Nucleic-acid-binding Zn-ribbon protein n=1 Tax=Desmospora profundinema TaxID=1571184 RepID=A0ABU1ILB1_9BACL|nr:zinc ribbon domain-containing protein [Desmospora profundinema]MDR6224590.1 putative nucleic-acid-binding Zn-ribbon protein [Desmospora profundinema]
MKEKGCPKCGCKKAAVREIAATGTGLSRMFDIQHNQFKVVSCKDCGYSELYSLKGSRSRNVLDLFFG